MFLTVAFLVILAAILVSFAIWIPARLAAALTERLVRFFMDETG